MKFKSHSIIYTYTGSKCCQWEGFGWAWWALRPLTFHAAATRLQHPGVHVSLGVGQELVSSQVCVMGGCDEVVAQRLIHVLIHLVVQRVENVACRTAHETCKTYGKYRYKNKMTMTFHAGPDWQALMDGQGLQIFILLREWLLLFIFSYIISRYFTNEIWVIFREK